MGSNLGPVQAARHLAGMVTAHMLSFTNQRHVTVEKLDAARAELIELYLMLDLPKTWGNGQTVAADGTQFDFYDNNLTVGLPLPLPEAGRSGLPARGRQLYCGVLPLHPAGHLGSGVRD